MHASIHMCRKGMNVHPKSWQIQLFMRMQGKYARVTWSYESEQPLYPIILGVDFGKIIGMKMRGMKVSKSKTAGK